MEMRKKKRKGFDFFGFLSSGWKTLLLLFWGAIIFVVGYLVARFFDVRWYSILFFFVLGLVLLLGLGFISQRIGLFK